MSTFEVPVVFYTLEKHPNADTLSIATIEGRGWHCVVKTSDFVNEGNLAVYVPIDAQADKEHPLLGFLEGKKVKTIRLRQVISQGVLLPFSKVLPFITTENAVYPIGLGTDLAKALNIRKWVAPVNNNLGACNAIKEPDKLQRYTEIENWKNYPNVIKPGELVFVTEKIHGTNCRFALLDGVFYIGSHRRTLTLDPLQLKATTAWHKVAEQLGIETILRNISKGERCYRGPIPVEEWKNYNPLDLPLEDADVVIYGEIFGKGVQDLTYGQTGYNFAAFDVLINGEYLAPQERLNLLAKYGLTSVPLLYEGEFDESVLELKNGSDVISNSNIREGIIIEPVEPRYEHCVGRVKLKVISEEYLLRKGGTDYEG